MGWAHFSSASRLEAVAFMQVLWSKWLDTSAVEQVEPSAFEQVEQVAFEQVAVVQVPVCKCLCARVPMGAQGADGMSAVLLLVV
jgi:hypothetical protein